MCSRRRTEQYPKSAAKKNASLQTVRVAVKVVHPEVRRSLDLDLKFLLLFAWLLDQLPSSTGVESTGVSMALRQFVLFLHSQTDFNVEADNLRIFRSNFGDAENTVSVPKVFDRWVSRDVVIMSWEEGESLTSLLESRPNDKARVDAWKQLVDGFCSMVLKHRYVHGDLHPGNILWRRSEQGVRLALVDCGLSIDLRGDAGEDLTAIVKTCLLESEADVGRKLMKLSERVGGKKEEIVNPEGFVESIAQLIREAKACPLAELNAASVLTKCMLVGRKHRVRFDARVVNLLLAVVVLQGVVMKLHPEGDLLGRVATNFCTSALTNAVCYSSIIGK